MVLWLALTITACAPAVPDTKPMSSSANTGKVSVAQVMSGFDRPIYLTSDNAMPDTVYIVEQRGRVVRVVSGDGNWQIDEDLIDLQEAVLSVGDPICYAGEFHDERGILGLAFAPDFEASRQAYLAYTKDADCQSEERGALVVSEFEVGPNGSADPHSERVVMAVSKPLREGMPRPNHNGGHIAFGPDGYLYIGFGEGGPGGGRTARSLDTLWGKLARIDPDDPDGAGPLTYRVPPDNPFVAMTNGELPEVWSLGLRNPWRWAFDSATGDLVIGDAGQFRYESVDRAAADAQGLNAGRGVDFGWGLCEGRHEVSDSRPGDAVPPACADGQLPVLEYEHLDGSCSVIGGYVYRGTDAEAWHGLYLFADHCDGTIRVMTRDGDVIAIAETDRTITSFGQDVDGDLYVTALDGSVHMIQFEGSP